MPPTTFGSPYPKEDEGDDEEEEEEEEEEDDEEDEDERRGILIDESVVEEVVSLWPKGQPAPKMLDVKLALASGDPFLVSIIRTLVLKIKREKLSVVESPAKKRKSSGGGGGGGGGASSVARVLKNWKGYFSSLLATFNKWLVFEEPCYTKATSQEHFFTDILSFVRLSSHYNSCNLCSHFLLGKALFSFLKGRREVEL